MKRCTAIALAAIPALFPSVLVGSKLPPGPVGYSSRRVNYHGDTLPYVEVFPPGCRNNPTDRPLCFFYTVDGSGRAFNLNAKLNWKAKLVNSVMPLQVLVPRNGKALITLNDYVSIGSKNCVVIYGEDGTLLKTYSLQDLYSKKSIEQIPKYMADRFWQKDAQFIFPTDERYLFIFSPAASGQPGQEMTGKVHRFDLKTGEMKIVPAQEGKPEGGWYYGEVIEYPLRFSSLTDIMSKEKDRPEKDKEK